MSRVLGVWAAFAIAVGSAVLIPTVAAGAAPPLGVVYGTQTSQGNVMTLTVNPARTQVVRIDMVVDLACTVDPAAPAGTQAAMNVRWVYGNIRIAPNGGWKAVEKDTQSFDDGTKWDFRFVYTGRRSGDLMIGNVNGVLTETTTAGAPVRTCRTRVITFRLPQRNVFGTQTAQRRLALIRLNPAGTRVTRVFWDWTAKCVPGPSAKPDTATETFQRDFISAVLPIGPNGAFRGTFDYDPFNDTTTGTTLTYSNGIVGRRVGATVRGTLNAKLVETETATGGVIRTCTSPSVKFLLRD